MMRRRAVSSTRRPSAWLVVAGGLVLYGTAVVILALARISPTKENIHVSAVDEDAILLATFDSRTTVGMVRLFAAEVGAAISAILAETRRRDRRAGGLDGPFDADEARLMFRERSR